MFSNAARYLTLIALLALTFSSCSKTPSSAKPDLKKALLARWPADTNSGPDLISRQAVLTGDVSVVSFKSAQAWSFDGNTGRVITPDFRDMHFGAGQDFSVAAWIKPERSTTDFGVMSIVEKRRVGGIATALGFSFHLEYGHLSCQLSPYASTKWKLSDFTTPARIIAAWQRRNALGPVSRFVSSGSDLRDGQFHHVAMTLERNSKTGGKLYVDGIAVLTFDPTPQSGSLINREPILIGNHPDSTLHCAFKGVIGDVRIYFRALTSTEVELLNGSPERPAAP